MINAVKGFLKAVVSVPFYVVGYFGTVVALLCLGIIDRVYPKSNASNTFIKTIIGFNQSPIEIAKPEEPKPKGVRIYR